MVRTEQHTLGGVQTAQGQGHVVRGLNRQIQSHSEACRASVFTGASTDRSHRVSVILIIQIDKGDIRRIQQLVSRIGTVGRLQADGVGLVSVPDIVVQAGDGKGLRCIPTGRGEPVQFRSDFTFTGIITEQGQGDIIRRLACQVDREGRR